MRIALINWSNRQVGGAETYVGQIAAALDDAGHELLFCAEQDGPSGRQPILMPRRVETIAAVASAPDTLREWRPDVLFVNGLVEPTVERTLLDVAPAVLLAHGYYGTCITGSKTHTLPEIKPCERTFGPACLAAFYPCRCGGRSPVTMWAEYRRQSARRALLSSYRAIVTFSDHMRREYLRHGIASDRVHTVPPLLESRSWSPASAGPSRRLIFAGRLDQLKGCRVLIESLTHVYDALQEPIELVVAGDGPDAARCRETAEARRFSGASEDRVRVTFTGWTPRDQLTDLVASSDLLVMPSLWPEPLGLSGLEALQLGTPVVAFATGGIPEWLEDGVDGYLAPADPPTAEGLASAIVKALNDRLLRGRVQERGQSLACGTLDKHLEALLPILRGAARNELVECTVSAPDLVSCRQ